MDLDWEAQRLVPLVINKGVRLEVQSQEEAGAMIQAGRVSHGQGSGHGDGNEGMVQEMFLM